MCFRKLSHNFEERASKIDIKRCIADVIAWTAVYFDNSEHAIVMTTKMAPTDDEDYIQEYPKEKSPQIERLGKYLRDEVLDKASKCIASLLSALLEGMQDAISRIPAFAAVAREYPEALCMAVDTVSAFAECDITPRLQLLQRIYNIWDVLFSDHFIVPKCNKHIHAFLRHKVINFAMLAVGDGTGKDPRELLLAKLYTLFASTSDPEHQVIYTEIIASVVSKYIPDDTTNISMSFNILAISPTIESPELAPRFTLARCGIINSLVYI